jgi:RNA-directed DNA polymerase
LQHALYRSAKADPGRRFHALGDKIHRRDVLRCAWAMVRADNGAPGIDSTTLAAVEEYGIDRLLGELVHELRQGTYRLLPARRVLIPKPGVKDERRPLSIPTVRDRVVQAAMKIVLESVFEADMLPWASGCARNARRMMPCRCSSTSTTGADGGWWRRTSPSAFRRSRMKS